MQPAVDAFLKRVLRSGLLDQEQLKAAYRAVPREHRHDVRVVAEHLVKTGKLSRFQSTKLLAGNARGLMLGHYQVLAPIGRGGMSTVYLARDSRDQKLLALKVLPPKKARRQERLLARFLREMDLGWRVVHPNIARTFEVGVQLGVYFIAMEFIPGKDLSKLVQEQGPLTVPRAARLFAEVASALQHAHDQGLVHRDLKPSNIRITPNDHAKVLDLGLALLEGEEVSDREVVGGHGYIVGSMDYIAPEQTFDACAVDGRADIYGMGCTLYYALTGRPPFAGGTTREKIMRQRNEEPSPLVMRNPTVPPGFAELVHRMMAKDPAKRFPTAESARRELLAWAPAESERPIDQMEDTGFRQAVASLQASETDDSLMAIPVAPSLAAATAPPFALYLWIAGGLLGLLLAMMIVVLALVLAR
jgi:serine/threonine protein kinase